MINIEKLKSVLLSYRKAFVTPDPAAKNQTGWEKEQYKWIAVKCFQDNWNIDADDFLEMFKKSTAKCENLLSSMNYFPRQMIIRFAEADAEAVRNMFRNLFDEDKSVVDRVNHFIQESERIRSQYGAGRWNSHYQNVNSVSTYLWLRYPDKYYIYKYSECKQVASVLESNFKVKNGAKADVLLSFLSFYNEIADYLKTDAETIKLIQNSLTSDCYADPQCRTLTIDVGFYISRYYTQGEASAVASTTETSSELRYWPSSEEYELNITKDEWKKYIEEVEYPNHKDCMVMLKELMKLGGEANCKKLADVYGGHPSGYVSAAVNMGKRAKKYFNLPPCMDGDVERYFAIPFLGRHINEDGTEFYSYKIRDELLAALNEIDLSNIDPYAKMDIIREQNPIAVEEENEKYSKEDFLNEVYMTENQYDSLVSLLKNKMNLILQGAPGVGKTFAAKRLAYSIMGEKDESRIEFVQFHQNYSYEDFMMGYKPTDTGFELKYGIFYRFCTLAANHPDKDYFFIIDEINRGNMSKIFGELLMLIEKDYRGTKATLAYNGMSFSVPENLYIIGMMNTADRSLAMIDYALRRRFSFFNMVPGFDSDGFKKYQATIVNAKFDKLVDEVKNLNKAIAADKSLGNGFCIGHSYFCGHKADESATWIKEIVDYDIIPMLNEYWFDDSDSVKKWSDLLSGAVNG